MAIIKSKALWDSDVGELKNKIHDLQLELMKLASQRSSKSISNPGKIKELKRSIAKILTVMNVKKEQVHQKAQKPVLNKTLSKDKSKKENKIKGHTQSK